MARWTIAVAGLLLVTGCTGGDAADNEQGDGVGDPVLGNGNNSMDDVLVEVLQDSKLDRPRDLAFNPLVPNELWVVNQETEGVTVIEDLGGADQTATKFDDDFAGPHFLAQPAGIAFGDNGAMATIHDTDKKTQGPNGTPGDFMGPTLWTTDLAEFDGGHHGHLDMLHNSPLGKGIAWESGNAYWVFDAYHSSITRYDFQSDHGLGGADHSDGITARYMEGEVLGVDDGTPSHLWYDHDRDELYIVDTGNNRILVLDATSGARGQNTTPNYDGADQYRMDDADFWTLIDGEEVGLEKPSGIAVHDGTIYITDNGNPAIYSFTMDGELIDYLELDGYRINGIAVDDEGRLLFVDPKNPAVVRISPK